MQGWGVSELRRLKQLEEENRRLKGLVADLTLDKHILQEVLRKKPQTPRRSPRQAFGGNSINATRWQTNNNQNTKEPAELQL